MATRVGWGFDAHRFGVMRPLLCGGVTVDPERGLEATSDGDVVAHAAADAVLGAAALGDLGTHFPSSDAAWAGADSMEILGRTVAMAVAAGWRVESIDVTVIAQTVRIAPFRESIRHSLAQVLDIALEATSVKATTTDGMGFIGRDEGVAAIAVAVLRAEA